MKNCPCDTGLEYEMCCGMYISGHKIPPTPVALMRSRYTAYSEANIDYIFQTMRSPAVDHFDHDSAKEWAQKTNWLQLEVIHSSQEKDKGQVEFLAHFRMDNKRHLLHEISEFQLIDNQWFYTDGQVPTKTPQSKISRNDLCPCGSNQKYKKCCGQAK